MTNAAVAEQADARDLKSLGVKSVSVQIRSAAPDKNKTNPGRSRVRFVFLQEIVPGLKANDMINIEVKNGKSKVDVPDGIKLVK